MPTELLVFIMLIAGVILGGTGHWWCWALPRYQNYEDDYANLAVALVEEERAHDGTKERLEAAETARIAAETALAQRLLTQDGVATLDAARAVRGRS